MRYRHDYCGGTQLPTLIHQNTRSVYWRYIQNWSFDHMIILNFLPKLITWQDLYFGNQKITFVEVFKNSYALLGGCPPPPPPLRFAFRNPKYVYPHVYQEESPLYGSRLFSESFYKNVSTVMAILAALNNLPLPPVIRVKGSLKTVPLITR